jgi:metallo-beta-lactamase class B
MKTIWRALFLLLIITPALSAQTNPGWHSAFPALTIAGNLYYVDTADLAVYRINIPQGNILIDSDFPEDVPLIRKSLEQLGFKYGDSKIRPQELGRVIVDRRYAPPA